VSAGTSFFALEERLLLAAQPVVVVADGLPTVAAPIGGQAQFTVTFDNTANPGNDNIGYAPFIDLVLPKRGADGVAPGTPPSLDPTQPNDDDGVTFASASYLGIPLSATVLVFDANGNATHPLLRDANNNPVVVALRVLRAGTAVGDGQHHGQCVELGRSRGGLAGGRAGRLCLRLGPAEQSDAGLTLRRSRGGEYHHAHRANGQQDL
jgi:hypothetical protein